MWRIIQWGGKEDYKMERYGGLYNEEVGRIMNLRDMEDDTTKIVVIFKMTFLALQGICVQWSGFTSPGPG